MTKPQSNGVPQPVAFEREVIDERPAGSRNDVLLLADVTGNGRNDIVVGGLEGEGNVVW